MKAQTLLRSTNLSMFYIACCAFVLMKHNAKGVRFVRRSLTLEPIELRLMNFKHCCECVPQCM